MDLLKKKKKVRKSKKEKKKPKKQATHQTKQIHTSDAIISNPQLFAFKTTKDSCSQ